jgi:RNA polymerase sigma-70 factor, ECF subfamily
LSHIAKDAVARDDLADLLLATARGDRIAFRHLFEATNQRLFGMVLLLLRRRDVAEDALQDGYLRIWSHARFFDPERGAAWSWVFQVARNAAIDRLRQDRRRFSDVVDHADTLIAPAAPVDARLDAVRALECLTDQQRTAVVLMYVHGLTCQQIADDLGAPLGTVKSWIRRGIERMHLHFHAGTVQPAAGNHLCLMK